MTQRGTIVTWFPDRGWGWVRPDDGPHGEVFCHRNGFARRPAFGEGIAIGTRITFRVEVAGGRLRADHVQVEG